MAFTTYGSHVRVRILQKPNPRDTELDGFNLQHFQVGQSYQVGPRLADYLIVAGYASLDRRQQTRAVATDRRRLVG